MEDQVSESGEKILINDKFFLLVNSSGFFMKTRIKKDFDEVSSWGNILFAEQVRNSDWLFFQVGSSILKKKINSLPISQAQEKTLWFDVFELDLKTGTHLNKCWVGKKAENYESL